MEVRSLRGIRQYELGQNSLLVIKYYIIEKLLSSGERCYGIEISQQKIIKDNIGKVEYDSLLLSESKTKVEQLIDKFIGNGVTPDTMEYIVDDLVELPC